MLDHLNRPEHAVNARRAGNLQDQQPAAPPLNLDDSGPLPSTSGMADLEAPAGDDQEPSPDHEQQEALSPELEEVIQRIARALAGLDEEDYLDGTGDGEEKGLGDIDEGFPDIWYDAEGG